MGIIYLATNKVTGKRYVGQTTIPLSERWRNHVYDSFHSTRWKSYFHASIEKYGASNFEIHTIIHDVPEKDLDRLEILWIKNLIQ